jgi:CDP-diacylglycerol--glycerol-3-phosphate 3-phosphatidyltransferase
VSQLTALPNVLSLLRIAIVPMIVVTLFWPGPEARAIAGALFLVAALTDFFDGWIARRRGVSTVLGKFLDPLADKLLVVGILIMLAGMPPEPRVPAWMAVVVASRELAVTGLRGIASQGGVVMAAEALGKYKMTFQIFALFCLLVHYTYPLGVFGLQMDFHAAGILFLWVAIVFAVWSAIDYAVRLVRQGSLKGVSSG